LIGAFLLKDHGVSRNHVVRKNRGSIWWPLITPFRKTLPADTRPTLTVNVTGSLMVLPMLVVRVHFRVLKVQLQPLVESVSENRG